MPSPASAKKHHKRAHASKKAKAQKHARYSQAALDRLPVAPAPAPAPEPMAAVTPAPSAPIATAQAAPAPTGLEAAGGHRVAAVTAHEASNSASQAVDTESPGRKK